jgi:4a-hydroxytetrahydrobiopterin dehydratase
MPDSLTQKVCTPCQGGVPPLTRDEAVRYADQVPDWVLKDDTHRIERRYRFANFREALALVDQIGALAEAEGHHPDLYVRWGEVRVYLWTHAIDGLTESDFIMAAKIDRLYAGRPKGRPSPR